MCFLDHEIKPRTGDKYGDIAKCPAASPFTSEKPTAFLLFSFPYLQGREDENPKNDNNCRQNSTGTLITSTTSFWICSYLLEGAGSYHEVTPCPESCVSMSGGVHTTNIPSNLPSAGCTGRHPTLKIPRPSHAETEISTDLVSLMDLSTVGAQYTTFSQCTVLALPDFFPSTY